MSLYNIFENAKRDSQNNDDCKGLFFRATRNHFINNNGQFVFTDRFSPLKKKSCKGCAKCDWMDEYIKDALNDGYFCLPEEVEPESIYQLKVISYSVDCETGHCDDMEIGFEKVKPDE